MEIASRQVDQYIWDPELAAGKMVFLSGPRQVGKTTYAKGLLARGAPGAYVNWDNPAVRRSYGADPLFFLSRRPSDRDFLVVFDEIHKRPRWKDILKGIYDTVERSIRILVTGSARLEWFRRSGDSLIGRYAHFHMMPISVSEALGKSLSQLWLCPTSEPGKLFRSLSRMLADAGQSRDTYEAPVAAGISLSEPSIYSRASARSNDRRRHGWHLGPARPG
jgi:predicted AAA+ superfamily ATPase